MSARSPESADPFAEPIAGLCAPDSRPQGVASDMTWRRVDGGAPLGKTKRTGHDYGESSATTPILERFSSGHCIG